MLFIREITTRKDIKQFILFAWEVYKNDPNWVPPLIFEARRMLDKKHSPFFEFGQAAYFMAFRGTRPVGRITAQINHRHNDYYQVQEGFFGFYECLPDDEAAMALLRAAETWVKSRGMTKLIGPENFTIYDEIGFLAAGWDAEPSTPVVMHTYTPRYYLEQMAAAGYQKEIDWLAFKVESGLEIKDVFLKAKARLEERRGLVFRLIDFRRLGREIPRVKQVFLNAWADNWGHFPYSDKQFEHLAASLKPIADPRLCMLVEAGDRPVACILSLPDVNPAGKKMNGHLFPFGIFHLLAAKKHARGLRTLILGVVEEYRHIGIDAALVVETFLAGRKAGYQWADCSLVVENNHKMIEPIKKWGGVHYRTYRLFSKPL